MDRWLAGNSNLVINIERITETILSMSRFIAVLAEVELVSVFPTHKQRREPRIVSMPVGEIWTGREEGIGVTIRCNS